MRTIQDALNRVTVANAAGGPMPFLAVDGICGPKTNAAIARFQQVQLKIFDGVIEPNKKTILKLNEILEPVSDEDLKAKVRLALPSSARTVQAAIANLVAAIARTGTGLRNGRRTVEPHPAERPKARAEHDARQAIAATS